MTSVHAERRLRQELHLIVSRLSHAGTLAATDELSGELVDDAQVVEHREDQQLSRARLAGRAKALVAALRNLHAGTYGTCDECGKAIPASRLRALPSATTCVRCQSSREEAHQHTARTGVRWNARRPLR